jgi:hypothetical protein
MLGGALLVIGVSPLRIVIAPALVRDWWILPLAVSTASVAVLTGSLVLREALVRRIPARFLSVLYLVCCPSLAVLGLPASLSIAMAPPTWVRFAAPALLLTSAWAYYRSLKYSDEDERKPSQTSYSFEMGT